VGVRPVRDGRELALLKSREGWFLECLAEEALEPSPCRVVTQSLLERLRASRRFEQVIRLAPEEEVERPFNSTRNSVPAELSLQGDLQIFYDNCGLAIIDPDTGARQVVPLPEKPISVDFHAAKQTAMLNTHAHRICLVDITAGKLVRFLPTRSDPDPMMVVSLSA